MQKVTISGSYRTKNDEIVDYADITGVVPDCDADTLQSVLQNRYAEMWLVKSGVKERVYSIRTTYLDKVEKLEGKPSFVGKDLKELTFEEMQDLATAKGLRSVPLWRAGSLREAQIKTYKVYSSEILKKKTPEDVTYDELPSIILDGKIKINDVAPKAVIEADEEELPEETPSELSFEDLKRIADSKGIKYHPNIGYDTLYTKVYG